MRVSVFRHLFFTWCSLCLTATIGCNSGAGSGGSEVDQHKQFRSDLKELTDARAAGDSAKVETIMSRMRKIDRIQPQLLKIWIPPEGMEQPPKEQRLTAAWLWKELYGIKSKDARTGFDRTIHSHAADAEKDKEVRKAMYLEAR